jgi:hypothetical protein
MRVWLWRGLTSALLVAVAAAYFALGANLTLEWADEGNIVYASWRTAEGALPYRDFRHLYGPSLFFLHGSLFRVFGPDLAVVRVTVIALKACIAVLVFVSVRLMVAWPFALLAYAALVAVWGLPLWLFATPYAHFHATLLNLGGVLLFVLLLDRPRLGAVLAGLCFGLASTFKQTTGLFAVIAMLWFVIARRAGGAPAAIAVGWRRALRMLALGTSLLVLAGCAVKNPDPWSVLVLLTPAVACVLWLARAEQARPPTRADDASAWSVLGWCGGATAVPWLAVGIRYASAHALEPMFRDLVREIPMRVSMVTTFPRPQARGAIVLLVVAALLAFPRMLAMASERMRGMVAVAGSGLAAATLVWFAGAFADGFTSWFPLLLQSLYWLPIVAVWLGLSHLVRIARHGSPPAVEAFTLFTFFAVTSLVFLAPIADVGHLLHGLPIFLILGASLIGSVPDTRPARVAAIAVAALIAGGIVIPCADRLRIARASRDAAPPALARATGVFDRRPEFHHEVDLIEWLRDDTRRDRSVFAIGSPQMLYFLVGKPSPVEHDEFVFFLASFGALAPRDASAMVDEAAVLARLQHARPLVVDGFGGTAPRQFREIFGDVSRYLDRHYRPVARFGPYTVLDAGPEGGARPF